MTNLTLAQRVTLNDMNLAPRFNKSFNTDDTFKFSGVVNGSWNKNTLKSLESLGLVELLGNNDGHGSFVLVTEAGKA